MSTQPTMEAEFIEIAPRALEPIVSELESKLQVIDPLRIRVLGARAMMLFELSKGHVWQLSVLTAPVPDGTTDTAAMPTANLVPLGFVLQALTEGIETHSPRWLTSSAELSAELDRLARRLADHGRMILGGLVDWQLARQYLQSAISRAALAASGRSRTARELEAAERAMGRDDFEEARTRYEKLGGDLGPLEARRLEALRRRTW